MLLSDFTPRSSLVTKNTLITRPRFPVIDMHNHLGEGFGHWENWPISELLDRLDQVDVRILVDLDGGWGEDILYTHLEKIKKAAPERFRVFGGVDFSQWPVLGDGFVDFAVRRLREQASRGADGLKIWKQFGLHVQDQLGQRVAVDDARLDPLWSAAGELGLPVLIHVADPVAFFDPLDSTNERWEELQAHPDWHFPSPPYPPFLTIVEELASLVSRHPETTFIGAHVACYSENLAWVSALLERCPNLYVDIGARLNELCRQPYTARRFFIQHADQIVFGTDAGPNVPEYRVYFRFLETDDEYFSYTSNEVPGQGRWMAYGLYLPEDVLAKVYYQNAAKILKIA